MLASQTQENSLSPSHYYEIKDSIAFHNKCRITKWLFSKVENIKYDPYCGRHLLSFVHPLSITPSLSTTPLLSFETSALSKGG